MCFEHYMFISLIPSGVFKGRRARHLPRATLFGGSPLRCYTRKFSLVLMKNLLFTHIMYYKADYKCKDYRRRNPMLRFGVLPSVDVAGEE